jgi:hypothetical protein
MRTKLSLVFATVLLCVFSTAAQTVIETESSVSFDGRSAIASITIESEVANKVGVPARLDLIDTNGITRSTSSRVLKLESGKQNYTFQFDIDQNDNATKTDFAWYRLRYRIGDASGTISMSQLFKDLFELRVIGSDSLIAGMKYRVRVLAVNPFSEIPASGVSLDAKVDLELAGDNDQHLKLASKAATDQNGFAIIDFEIPVDAKLNREGEIKITGRKNGFEREAEQELNTLDHDVQFLMMTDKPIYQPEQLFSVRGILLKGAEARTIVGDSQLEFRIRDEDDKVLFRSTVRTSAFGVASADWQIPKTARLGRYTVEVRDENDDVLASRYIRVSRYDLPNFVVEAKPSKPFYLPGETEAEVSVHADYLFGKPVTKGKVRVVQEKSREWNWKEQKYDVDEGETREGMLDATGKFTTHFNLTDEFEDLKDEDYRKYEDIHYAAYLTDLTTNKTEQRRFDIRVSKEPIHVYFMGPESYEQSPSLPINAYVSTFYADGTPAQCDVEIKASVEYENKFKTVARLKTNALGAGKITMQRPKMGEDDDDLDLRVIARDKNGRKGTATDDLDFDDDDAIEVTTDRAIYKPGDTVNVSVVSTLKDGKVFLDIVDGWTVIDSRTADLNNGHVDIQVPYSSLFRGVLKVAAYIEKADELIKASRGIIFPAKRGIAIDASFDKAAYKPNDEATVRFSVVDNIGNALESALGVVVLDKAVEERSRTDNEFGSIWRDYSGLLGYGDNFGSINVKDINELDLSKPINADLQIVAEILFHTDYYSPSVFHSENYYDQAKSVFAKQINDQFAPVSSALNYAYQNRNYLHPVNEESLRSILADRFVRFDLMRDPWGTPYKAAFAVDKTRDLVTIVCAGPDKQFDTRDDFTAFTIGFDYFTPMGKAIDAAVQSYNIRTGNAIRDDKTLYAELGVGQLLDRWGHPYKVVFDGNGRYLQLHVRSAGPDGVYEKSSYDDFEVWNSQVDFFAGIERKINNLQTSLKVAPQNENDFRMLLKSAGINFDDLRDAFGRPLYIDTNRSSRYWDKITVESVRDYNDKVPTERRTVTPVTQQIIEFDIRSLGRDGTKGNWDDIWLGRYIYVLSEQRKDDSKPVPVTQPISFVDGSGSIAGTVTDANGAVIPGASVTAQNESNAVTRTVKTGENGNYLIAALAPGTYSLTVTARAFKNSVVQKIPVRANATAQVNVVLSPGGVSETVDVVSTGSSVEMTSASVGSVVTNRQITDLPLNGRNAMQLMALRPGVTIVTKSGSNEDKGTSEPNSTPRVREYFPETLLWRPEVITDSSGRAEIKFRMADNITTWKMYAVASTRSGQIGVSEKEVTAFQSFFVDLDPPKFLTQGDEIYLPTQVRNYTEKQQKVDVTMDKADWFTFLGGGKQQVTVNTGSSENAVFGFKAAAVIEAGKQRVTAMGQTDSDAIERPVTVRPDGEEIVRTDSRYFTGSAEMQLEFPSNALPATQSAQLKIYPNLFSHVSESVEGLLHRPYGCGEQTISSTYPNLMILKFIKKDSAIKLKAQRYLQKGYERLLGYQSADGGFTYWGGKDAPDLALTAYALRFLSDAGQFIAVDEDAVKKAQEWLVAQQKPDGSWQQRYRWENEDNPNPLRAKLTTTYVVRTLAMLKASRAGSASAGDMAADAALAKGLGYLKQRHGEIDEPYAMALFGLASLDAGDVETAKQVAAQLEKMAIPEGSAVYWKLETNTPFYGWGTAGRIETTALVLQLLTRVAKAESKPSPDVASKGLLFLLKNKDRYGVWYSTQTTINVLDSFLAILASDGPAQPQNLQVTVNGKALPDIPVAADRIEPVVVDLAGKLSPTSNTIEVRGAADAPLMAQMVATHYIDWRDSKSKNTDIGASRALKLVYKCDKTNPAIMEEVTCSVDAERIGSSGYGMLLAEIGTPPGADVSRESLEAALQSDWSLSRYDILPDRVVLYMWSKPGGTKFNFKLRPRYGINAQTPASIVYDYYNPEAHATVAPLRFVAK